MLCIHLGVPAIFGNLCSGDLESLEHPWTGPRAIKIIHTISCFPEPTPTMLSVCFIEVRFKENIYGLCLNMYEYKPATENMFLLACYTRAVR